jgi:N-acylneuraminate cytidylyltransferase
MEICSIIPARSGSKGIPRKNLQIVAGKELIAYMIEASKKTKHINRVIVSTDDTEIKKVSENYGAEVIMRPAEISGDSASSESALLHVLKYLQHHEDYMPDITVFLQCTSPLTTAEDIDNTIESLLRDKADTAFSVTPFHYYLWEKDEEGNAVGVNHDKSKRLLRQQQKPQYLETGAVYVMLTKQFLGKKHRFFGKISMYNVPSERVLEIDEPADVEIAKLSLNKRE